MTESAGEFSMLGDNAADAGLAWHGPPAAERREVVLGGGRVVSSILWGTDPQLVFLHGGAQNAHTWDTVALALDRPLVAVDLPGHAHSDGGRTDRQLSGLLESAEADFDPGDFRRYGSARQLYNFQIDNAGAY